uniref:Secreted protein n=1 Tax=Arundo donax TaxID=35708 RepID=A0A0A9HSN0_ARUDO
MISMCLFLSSLPLSLVLNPAVIPLINMPLSPSMYIVKHHQPSAILPVLCFYCSTIFPSSDEITGPTYILSET